MSPWYTVAIPGDTPEEELLAEMRKTYYQHDMLASYKDTARAVLVDAVKSAVAAGELPGAELPDFVVEVPGDAANGDLAANLAMVSARAFKLPPRKIAEAVVAHLPEQYEFERVEVAGPGFINLFYSESLYGSVILAACTTGADYGRTDVGNGEKVNVEFVSANPTGPMHLGNARGGALGDCLAEALSWAGYEVCREFYINDAGNQIAKFGLSLAARYLQIVKGEEAVAFPEDGYQGEDIKERAGEFYDIHGDAFAERPAEELEQALIDYALPKNIADIKDHLAKYRVSYDVWFSESALHESGAVDAVVKELGEKGATYESEGAVWYKATDHGHSTADGSAEKDEVLVRANGIPTYFAADIAYHADKFRRGFARCIDVWGADHHGHVARMKGAMDAMGLDGSKLDIVLMQFVRLVRDGEPVRMSKRTGKAITLTDLLEEVPIDSARFFFNMREPGSQIEFDLGLAVAEDNENPVYYVQYAHARICSILRTLAEDGVEFRPVYAFGHTHLLMAPEERALIRLIAAFPGEIASAAKSYDSARITRYLMEMAAGLHRFYNACRIRGEAEELIQARLALCMAAKHVLKNGLSIIKVEAPERM